MSLFTWSLSGPLRYAALHSPWSSQSGMCSLVPFRWKITQWAHFSVHAATRQSRVPGLSSVSGFCLWVPCLGSRFEFHVWVLQTCLGSMSGFWYFTAVPLQPLCFVLLSDRCGGLAIAYRCSVSVALMFLFSHIWKVGFVSVKTSLLPDFLRE